MGSLVIRRAFIVFDRANVHLRRVVYLLFSDTFFSRICVTYRLPVKDAIAMKFNKTFAERNARYYILLALTIMRVQRPNISVNCIRINRTLALLRTIMRCHRMPMRNISEIIRNLFNYNAINSNIEAFHPYACECQ